jgi:hypothetical protein
MHHHRAPLLIMKSIALFTKYVSNLFLFLFLLLNNFKKTKKIQEIFFFSEFMFLVAYKKMKKTM